jgi:hypothetical protein
MISKSDTILCIFDPDCGHCGVETPKLVSFYNSRTYDLELFAVSADTSMQKKREYVRDMGMNWITLNGLHSYAGPYQNLYDAMTTPSLYIINNKSKFIGKKVQAAKLGEFSNTYEILETIKSRKKSDTRLLVLSW